MFYLDNAATTCVSKNAADKAVSLMCEQFGNPSSLHGLGLNAHKALEQAREQVAVMLGCQSGSVIFTGSGTESANLALQGAAAVYGKRRRHILSTAVEHACVAKTLDALEQQGFEVTRLSPQNVTAKNVVDALRQDTCLVSVMHVNNETGEIFPVEEIASAVKSHDAQIIFHSDGVQAGGKLPLKLSREDIDLYGISAHKIHGPKGVGALYMKKGIRITPIQYGGGQEQGLRSGTESVPLMGAFGVAAAEMTAHRAEFFGNVKSLWEALYQRLGEMKGVCVNSAPGGSPYILNLSMEGYPSEVLLHFLEERQVYVSGGSACSKGKKSPVLGAFGLSDARVKSALRVSFSPHSTMADVDAFCEGLAAAAKQLAHR